MCLLSFLLLHNQLFYLENHALPNYSHLYMKYKQHLITSQLLMWEMYFLISQNLLIKSGMAIFYSNYKHMEVKVNFLPYLKLFWWSWIKNNTVQMCEWKKINSLHPTYYTLNPTYLENNLMILCVTLMYHLYRMYDCTKNFVRL